MQDDDSKKSEAAAVEEGSEEVAEVAKVADADADSEAAKKAIEALVIDVDDKSSVEMGSVSSEEQQTIKQPKNVSSSSSSNRSKSADDMKTPLVGDGMEDAWDDGSKTRSALKKMVSFDSSKKPPQFRGSAPVHVDRFQKYTKPVMLSPESTPKQGPTRKQSSRRSVGSNSRYKIDPVTLLTHKQPNFQGNFNTMAVFETLPSMYSTEKFEELQQKRRVDLPFEYLYWLSRFDPQAQDGHHLENIIDKKIEVAKIKLDERINVQQTNLNKVNKKMTEYEKTMALFRNEVAQISKLRNQMHDVADESTRLKSTLAQIEYKTGDLSQKISHQSLNMDRKIGELEAKHNKLDAYAHRPNNFLQLMKAENEKLETRLLRKIEELQMDLMDQAGSKLEENTLLEEWKTRQEKLYELNLAHIQKAKTDIEKSERKFTVFEAVMSEFNINIEALKTHALSTDLHLESTLPIQIASIAFDVGLGTIMKKQFPKYRTNFKKRVKILEKNYQDCCDPFINGYESAYRKQHYELPDEFLAPTKMITKNKESSGAEESFGDDGSPRKSQSKEKRMIPKGGTLAKRRRSSVAMSIEKTLGDLQNDSSGRRRRDSASRRDSMASFGLDRSSDLPASISKQLLETLTKWQPLDSKWTIGKLFQKVTVSVTEFLKIPMNEMNTDQFYSLYAAVDNQELGIFKPLPTQGMEGEQMMVAGGVEQDSNGLNPGTFSEAMVADAPKSVLKKSKLTVDTEPTSGTRKGINFARQSSSKDESSQSQEKGHVGFSENPRTPLVKKMPPIDITSVLPQFSRLRSGSSGLDPRAARQQERFEKAEALKLAAERRKMQEQLTTAIETVANRIDVTEKTFNIRTKRMDDTIKAQKIQIEELRDELETEKLSTQSAISKKDLEINDLAHRITASRLKIKSLVGDLEESIRDQIKIPQLQILHTEYMRLKENEAKGVESLMTRKAEIKAYALANGGKIPKDDGHGVVVRKELTSSRNKLRIIKKKIKKFGDLGKIPMGASHRIYHEQSDSNSSSEETSEITEDSESSVDSDGLVKSKKPKIQKKKQDVLSTGLVYQPKFQKVVKPSSNSLGKYKDMLNLDTAIQDDKIDGKSNSSTPQMQSSVKSASQFGFKNIDVPIEISEVDSVSNSSDNEDSSIRISMNSKSGGNTRQSMAGSVQKGFSHLKMHRAESIKEEKSDEEEDEKSPAVTNKRRRPMGRNSKPRHQSSDSLIQAAFLGAQAILDSTSNKDGQDKIFSERVSVENSMLKQTPVSLMELDDSDKAKQQFKLARQMTTLIGYGSKKASNSMLRTYKQDKRTQNMRDAEAQTDPIRLGDIQIESDDEEEKGLEVNRMRVEAGTDAPQFMILNVVPGRPDSSLFERMQKEPEETSRIRKIVAELKIEKIKKGEPIVQHNLENVMHSFAMLKGEMSGEVRQIQLQNSANRETYTCYKQHQEVDFFKKAITEQKRLYSTDAMVISGKSQKTSSKNNQYQQQPHLHLQTLQNDKVSSHMSHKSGFTSHAGKINNNHSVVSKAKSVRRGAMRSNREEDIVDDKSHMTRKSGKTQKSMMSKRSRRKTQHQIEEQQAPIDKATPSKSHKSQAASHKDGRAQSAKKSGGKQREQADQIDELNKNLDRSVNSSFIDSSFDASLSDDDDDDDEDDDYVTFKEFDDFQTKASSEIAELKKTCDKVINKNMTLLGKVDSIDWTVVNQAETKLAQVLGDFQLSCDGLLLSIEADIKRWKTQQAELETKNETMALQIQNLTTVTDFLREEFFGFQDDNWALQESLIKFAHAQVGLAEADELDKQNISLVGQREVADLGRVDANLQEHHTVGLDPNCKSCQCSNNLERTALLQNLKLACLMYKPNPVSVFSIAESRPIPRGQVVAFQRQITDSLESLSVGRKARVDHFKAELKKMDEEMKSLKLQRQPSPTQSTLRFLQCQDEQTLSPLNFESLAERSRRFKIEIHTTSPKYTDHQSTLGSPRYVDQSQQRSGSKVISSNITQMRKPILKGKIESRAVLGLNQNLNTASTFTYAQFNERASVKKLSHTASDKFKDFYHRPGDQNYKTSTPRRMQETEINYNQSAAKVESGIGSTSGTITLVSKSHLGGANSRRIFSSNDPAQKPQTARQTQQRQKIQQNVAAMQSLSPRGFRDKIQISDKGFEGAASNTSMPLADHHLNNKGHRFSQEINSESELPALSNRGVSANQKNTKSQANSDHNWQGVGINIMMEQTTLNSATSKTNFDHKREIGQLNKASARELSRNETSSKQHDTLKLIDPSIKVEVRNSRIFGVSDQAAPMSDSEIRAVRRNIIKPKTKNRTSANATNTKVNSIVTPRQQ